MIERYVLATSKVWDPGFVQRLEAKLGASISLINRKDELTLEFLDELSPKFIFFPHWSYIIPPEIFDKYNCVLFHMTDLPFGRGGSPLQNLISRGIKTTKVSALKVQREVDGGDIYLKKELDLSGRAEDIYKRATGIIEGMIVELVTEKLEPVPQSGDIVEFTRRRPEQSRLPDGVSLQYIYDHIRMLDAEGYPHAFIENSGLRYEFTHATFDKNEIMAKVRISSIKIVQ